MRIKNWILAIVVAMMATACGDDEPKEGVEIYQDVMTFEGNSGGNAYFSFQALDDSGVIKVYGAGTLSGDGVNVGMRVLVTYSMPQERVYPSSGEVQLRSVGKVYQPTLEVVESLPSMDELNAIYVNTLYRTGGYLNLRAMLAQVQGREFRILVDEASLATGRAVIAIDTRVPEGAQGYDATSVMSADISELWDRVDIEGVDVLVNNTNNVYQRRFSFDK